MKYFQRFILLVVLAVIYLPQIQAGASNSLADCQVAAAKFRSTINYTASNITATTGVNVTCSTSGVVCPGQVIGSVCVWQRKLSAVCRNASGVIKIRIQTNGLPPRCANVPSGSFSELNVDFEVNFNPDVSINSLNQNFATSSALSQTMCTATFSYIVPSTSGYVNYGTTNIATVTGISVDGVLIFSPDSANNVDPFYPPAGFGTESVDFCFAHCQTTGIYHYHIGSTCMINPPNGTVAPCTGGCATNIANYTVALFGSYQTLTVLGLAKDGHFIYGPYLSAGNRVTSGFDVCNGMFYDSVGNYAYFATATYPYIVGCFGPGNYPSFGPNCSTNAVSSYSMSSYATLFLNVTNSTTSGSTLSTIASSSSASSSSSSPASSSSSSPASSSSSSPASSSSSSPASSSSSSSASSTSKMHSSSSSLTTTTTSIIVNYVSMLFFFVYAFSF